MALPTFDELGDAAGLAQATGGMEILRLLANQSTSAKVVVITQYPEIIINNESVSLVALPGYIKQRYSLNLGGAILYSYNQKKWREQLVAQLQELL